MTKYPRIRYGSFGPIVETSPGDWRMADDEDLNILPVGPDLSAEEEEDIE